MKGKSYFAMFVAGALVGSAAAWYFAKQKYEKIASEEIESVKRVFSGNRKDKETGEHEGLEYSRLMAEQAKKKGDIAEYTAILQRTGYAGQSDNDIGEERSGNMKKDYPYVISPDEFGEFDDYERISLTYYADGILTDDNDDIIEDVEDVVGDGLEHFGEYEDDSVFVRCDERKCDYEILLDQRNFSDVSSIKPQQVNI